MAESVYQTFQLMIQQEHALDDQRAKDFMRSLKVKVQLTQVFTVYMSQ